MAKANRTILYVIYEKYGVLDEWYEKLFMEFKKHGSYLLCMVNGDLNQNARKLVDKYFNKVIYRANKGYDVTAYKEGVLYLACEKLLEDELLMCNNSFFAPIYPFKYMFETMDKSDYDFWGITSVKANKNIPTHIQSYFYVFRKKIIEQPEFINFFKNIKKIKNYQDAINKVEFTLTDFFVKRGFKAGTYMDKVIKGSYNLDQLTLIKNGCPILKRRKLIYSKKYGYNHGINNIYLLDYIEKNTDFEIAQIYKNISREFSPEQIDYCMNSNIILNKPHKKNNIENYKIKYIISYNEKSFKTIEQLQNKYDFPDDIEYIKTDSIKGVFNYIVNTDKYDFYAHIGLVWRDFLPNDINFLLMEHLYLSIVGSGGGENNKGYIATTCNYLNHYSYIGMLYPFDFFHGIKFNNIVKIDSKVYDIIKKNNINIPAYRKENLCGLSSSFIITKQVQQILKTIDYSELETGYKSYISGGTLIRYLVQSKGMASFKIAESEIVGRVLSNYVYKYYNSKLEDKIKAWWLTNRINI